MAGDRAALTIKGLPQLTRACDQIQKRFEPSLAQAAQAVARDVVAGARSYARSPQAKLAASTLNAGTQGDAGTVTSTSALFAGAEFGGRGRPSTMQFPPHMGKRGYFLYPWMRANSAKLQKHWDAGVDEAMAPWDYKPGLG